MHASEALRPLRGVSISLFAAFVLLVGCSNPLNIAVAKLTAEQRVRVQQMLSVDELKELEDWTARNTADGKQLPPDVTVEQALKDQYDWQTKRKMEEANAVERQKKMQEEHLARQQELARMLAITLVSKTDEVLKEDRKIVALDILYDNKTDKDIQGVTGVIRLTDVYGNKVIDISWSYDGVIASKHTNFEHDFTVAVNKSMESQVNFWNTGFDILKSNFDIDAINFKDGTSVNASE